MNPVSIDVFRSNPALLDCKTVRIFAYSSTREQSNKRSEMRLKTESETGLCEARARKTLTPRFTDFFTDFEKKTDCFAVYRFTGHLALEILAPPLLLTTSVFNEFSLPRRRTNVAQERVTNP